MAPNTSVLCIHPPDPENRLDFVSEWEDDYHNVVGQHMELRAVFMASLHPQSGFWGRNMMDVMKHMASVGTLYFY